MWKSLYIPDEILKAIDELGFAEPTPIQRQVLPLAIRDYADILGSAPTGSGKTLAFGIPLLTRVHEAKTKFTASLDTDFGIKDTEMTDISTKTGEQMENMKKDKPSEPISTQNIKLKAAAKYSKTDDISKSETNLQKIKVEKCTKLERKRREVFDNLGMIEELDPDTMEVVYTHDISKPMQPEVDKLPKKQQTKQNKSKSKENLGKKEKETTDQSPHPGILALVLLPTRELALQVTAHLKLIAKYISPAIGIQAIVGGISIQKQTRLLLRRPEVIVATPGRLWEFIQQEHEHMLTIQTGLRVLVFDEADRLVESNHFTELRSILKFLHLGARKVITLPQSAEGGDSKKLTKLQEGKRRQQQMTLNRQLAEQKGSGSIRRQTFVFSATLTFVHDNALMPGARANSNKNKKKQDAPKMDTVQKLSFLRDMLGLSTRAKVVDLSHQSVDFRENLPISMDKAKGEGGIGENLHRQGPIGLSEFRLACPTLPEKDVYLLWFLMVGRQRLLGGTDTKKLGRCLIFLNSKSGIRRLNGVMRECAQTGAFAPSTLSVLHADMMQKQRFRSMDKFMSSDSGIIMATDVAARGLDFTSVSKGKNGSEEGGVRWVVHFDVPRTAELYIHRCGRTARANWTGTSLLLIEPSEGGRWKKVFHSLSKSGTNLPDLEPGPTTEEVVDCKQIVRLMRELDEEKHTFTKAQADRDWFKRTAKEADLVVDSDCDLSSSDGEDGSNTKKRQKMHKSMDDLRHDLTQLLDAFQEKQTKFLNSRNTNVGKRFCSFSAPQDLLGK